MAAFGRRSSVDNAPPQAGAGPVTPAASPAPAAGTDAAKPAAEERLKPQVHSEDTPADKEKAKALSEVAATKDKIYTLLMEQIDLSSASRLPRPDLKRQIIDLIGEIVMEQKMLINQTEQQMLANQIVDDMLGLGPLEPLLQDETITDIMVNGPNQVYVEQKGKLRLTDIKFRDNGHVMSIAQRIVTAIGRRVDESSPICDARLMDGSRVNVIAPPLAIRGCSISIRKFSKKKITLDIMAGQKNISDNLCKVLKIAGAIRLNIIISGGTGSGKTTLLNALSQMIDHGERIGTIEDAAELQLQQPHVVPLETRPANLEGEGEITMRDLVKNALRMRPDRIILGEVRGAECIDLLQAMNTGHDGSMATIHANNPRDCLSRVENLIALSGIQIPLGAMRQQISSAINVIVQVARMRDGGRRITHIEEIVGMEGEIITTQSLFTFQPGPMGEDGKLTGKYVSSKIRPKFYAQAQYFGREKEVMECLGLTPMA